MTPSSFLEHWQILENPFRGEEARQDAVLARLVSGLKRHAHGGTPIMDDAAANGEMAAVSSSLSARAQHNDYEKVVGDMQRPTSSVVFGEKGSGKTALRLQIQHAAAVHNAAHPSDKTLVIAHDELTPFLERLHARLVRQTRKGETSPADSFKQTRLVDHMDAALGLAVPPLVDALLENNPAPTPAAEATQLDLGPEPRRTARAMDRQTKRDLLILQAVYDKAEGAGDRAKLLRRAVGVHRSTSENIEWAMARFGWTIPLATLGYLYFMRRNVTGKDLPESTGFLGWRDWLGFGNRLDEVSIAFGTLFVASLLLWFAFVIKRWWTHQLMFNRFTRRVFRQVRVTGRSERSFASSLHELPSGWRGGGALPTTDADSTRFEMLQRLRRVLKQFGYASLLIVIDRVDEPSLIGGDVERMRSVVWPLFNNAFLQLPGVTTKLLLPIELRHALMRESATFFQQARMDKQHMVEQLGWTGPMLYDLCDARLAACRAAGAPAVTLSDLFAADVSRDAIMDALENMRQPRDAFKLVYQCIAEHCASTSAATAAEATDAHAGFRIARLTLESVKKQQGERMRQLAMGIRPA